MSRKVLISLAVLIAAAIAIWLAARYIPRTPPTNDPVVARLNEMVSLMERTCVVSSETVDSASVMGTIKAIKGIDATASVEARERVLRGASGLSEEVARLENESTRECMKPMADAISAAALKAL